MNFSSPYRVFVRTQGFPVFLFIQLRLKVSYTHLQPVRVGGFIPTKDRHRVPQGKIRKECGSIPQRGPSLILIIMGNSKQKGGITVEINLEGMTRKEQVAYFLRLADIGILPKPTPEERSEAEAFINGEEDD